MSTPSRDVVLLGSEMLTWSDLHGEAGAFGGSIAPHLLGGFSGSSRRVLIAGPATPEVIIGLAERFENADALTRSWPDAQELRERLPADVRVYCGPLDRMPTPQGGYDAVVAVAGSDRLHSAEETTPTWREVVAQLVRLLGESGELYLAVGNSVGVDKLLGIDPVSTLHDAAWPQGHARVHEPRNNAEVLGDLAQHGLVEVETWMCHGPRNAPGAAAPRGLLEKLWSDPVLLHVVEGAYDATRAAGPHLRDPGTVAAELLEAGLGAATAPLSVLHVRRGGDAVTPGAPAVLVEEHQAEVAGSVGCRFERTGSGWVRTLLGDAATYELGPGLTRDLTRLEGEVPPGDVFSALLRDLLAQHDVAQAAALIRRLRDWLGPTSSSSVDVHLVPVLLDRVAVAEAELRLIDPSFVATETADRDVVLLRCLMRFALDLLARGTRHPWSAASTPRSLAASLAAGAGLEVNQGMYERAVELDRALSTARAGVVDFEAPAGGDHAIAAVPYVELVDLSRALAVRAADQEAHVVWLLDAVQRRQRRLRKARGRIRAVEESREYRLGRRLLWLRDLRRRRLLKAREAERGRWRERGEEERVDTHVYVEKDLVPPGYVPQDGVTITPTGVDPGAESED